MTALPTDISPGDPGHILDSETVHALLNPVDAPFGVTPIIVEPFLADLPVAGQAGRLFGSADTGELRFDTGTDWLQAGARLLGVDGADSIDFEFTIDPTSSSGTRGAKYNRSGFGLPLGISWLHAGTPKWDGPAMDNLTDDYVVAYDHTKPGDVLRLSTSADDTYVLGDFDGGAKMVFGESVGRPHVHPGTFTVLGSHTAGMRIQPYWVAGSAEDRDPIGLWVVAKQGTAHILLTPFDEHEGEPSPPALGHRQTMIDFGDGQTFRLGVDRDGNDSNDVYFRNLTDNSLPFIIEPGGSVYLGGGALPTTATTGYVLLPGCNGVPTGAPAEMVGGGIPTMIDFANFRIYGYMAGAWQPLT